VCVCVCVCVQLRAQLTSLLLDQLPVLSELQRHLEHLAIVDPPPAKSDLILEQVCVIIISRDLCCSLIMTRDVYTQ